MVSISIDAESVVKLCFIHSYNNKRNLQNRNLHPSNQTLEGRESLDPLEWWIAQKLKSLKTAPYKWTLGP